MEVELMRIKCLYFYNMVSKANLFRKDILTKHIFVQANHKSEKVSESGII